MKSFLLKTSAWLALALVCHLIAAFFADGHTDEYYLKFTGEQRPALVLGSSRAAQGIDPAALNALLAEGLRDPGMLNFSFTIGHSPYGPTYLDAVRKKLDPTARNGLFILCVDPWSLSIPKGTAKGMGGPSPEDTRMLGKQWMMNATPNLEYLVRNHSHGWGSLIGGPLHDLAPELILHGNGRLEVRIASYERTDLERRAQAVETYTTYAEKMYERSPFRIVHLRRTIELLKQHGTVVLLVLPLHQDIRHIEQRYWPTFDQELKGLADPLHVAVLDHSYMGDSLLFTDGHHLDAASVPGYSRTLAKGIGELTGRSK